MITISGGVISKQRGSSVVYKLMCDRCGIAETNDSFASISIGVTEVSTKKCSNCGNKQIVKIKYTVD
jgi:hypothetical protein